MLNIELNKHVIKLSYDCNLSKSFFLREEIIKMYHHIKIIIL